MLKHLKKDMLTIKEYIEQYGHSFDKPIEAIDTTDLSFEKWAYAKRDLFKLFGNKLIVNYHTPLHIENDPVELMTRSLVHEGGMSLLYEKLKERMPEEYHKDLTHLFCNPYTLGYNKTLKNLRLPLNPAKNLDVPAGARPLRVIQKLAKAYDMEDLFKLFQRDHSLTLNQTHIDGTLHLSIHPMDFLTCSDNTYSWSSCMTVRKIGDYRAGVIEMLNSPSIIEAYIKTVGGDWLDKKWRCFFIVSRSSIIAVRAYPYDNSALVEKCGRWLAELANKNWGIEFSCEDEYMWHTMSRSGYGEKWNIAKNRFLNVDFTPGEDVLSYPDEFRVGEKHFGVFTKHLIHSTVKTLVCNYFGEAICPICGEPLEYSFQILCEECAPFPVCDKCGRPITVDRDLIYPDTDEDAMLCVDCYEDAIDVCSISNEVITDWVEVLLDGANSYITISKEVFNNKELLSKYFKASPHVLDDSIAHPEYWIEAENLTELGRELYGFKSQEQWESFLRNRVRF